MTEETDNMKKTLWMAFGTCAALTAGMFLYEGGVLFFGYHDRRMGVYVLASGILVTSSFLWSLYKSCSGEKCADRMKRAEECGTILSAGMAVLGITIYSMRYMNHPSGVKGADRRDIFTAFGSGDPVADRDWSCCKGKETRKKLAGQ